MTKISPNTQFHASSGRRLAFPLAFLLVLSACVATPPAQSSGAGSLPTGIEPVTGLEKASLAAVTGMQDGDEYMIVVFYLSGKASPSQLAAVPAHACASRGQSVASSEDMPLEHPSEMPGTRKLVIRCH